MHLQRWSFAITTMCFMSEEKQGGKDYCFPDAHTHTILYSQSPNNSPSLMGILLLLRCWSKKGLRPTARQTTKQTILDRGTPQSISSLAVSKHFKTGTAVLQRAEKDECQDRSSRLKFTELPFTQKHSNRLQQN